MANNSTHTDFAMMAGPTEVDTDESKIIKLRIRWEKQMRHFSPKKRHSKVEVLLLYWDKLSESYLDTDKEIGDLKDVFEKKYNFNVTRHVLNPPDNKDVTLRIHMLLANFVYEHDADDALLIIYYAGHGNPGKDGELMLRGNNRPTDEEQSEIDEIAWKKAEVIIDAARKADFLLIFDCCFAGRLVGSSSRNVISARNFEFFGASGASETTVGPGEKSFTHALIKALETLARHRDGFTTTELYSQIFACTTFPKDEQTPVLESRTNCHERLLLTPLDEPDAMSTSTASLSEDNSQQPAIQYCFTLDFLLTSLPTEHDMDELCNSLKILPARKGLPAQKFVWNNMYRKGNELSPAVKAAAHWWRWRAQTGRHGSTLNRRRGSVGEPGNTAANPVPLEERPEQCVPAAIQHKTLRPTLKDAEHFQDVKGFGEMPAGVMPAGVKAMQGRLARRRSLICRLIMSAAVIGVMLLYWGRDLFQRFGSVEKVKAWC